MNATDIYERIQKNKALADLEEERRTDVAVDKIVEVLCGSTTTGPHTFYAYEFATYEGSFASSEAVASRLRKIGLEVMRDVDEHGRAYVDVTVPAPEVP